MQFHRLWRSSGLLLLILVAAGAASPGSTSPSERLQPPPEQEPPAPPKPAAKDSPTTKPKLADSRTRGRELLMKVLEASGGVERLKALRSLRWKATESRRLGADGVLERDVEGCVVFPDRMRIDIGFYDPKLGRDRDLSFCLDRETGWQRIDRKVSDWAAATVQSQRTSLLVSTTPLLRNLEELKVSEADPSMVAGKSHRTLVVHKTGLPTVHFFIDPENFRVAGRRTTMLSQGRNVVREERLWDYRKVGELWLPFSRQISDDGVVEAVNTLISYTLNDECGEESFSKPTVPPK